MNFDDNARQAASDVREQLANVDVPSAQAVVRRARNRRRAKIAAVGAAVAVVAGVAFALDRAADDTVTVTTPEVATEPETTDQADRLADLPEGAETEAGWSSIPKEAAGIDAGASLSALASTDTAIIAGGATRSDEGWRAAIWRSEDGLRWEAADFPAASEEVSAIAHGPGSLLAVVTEPGRGPTTFRVWESNDDGATWQTLAKGTDLFGAPQRLDSRFIDGLFWNEAGFWLATGTGGSPDSGAQIWSSDDGVTWAPLLPENEAPWVRIVETYTGEFLAYSAEHAWSSDTGESWTPVGVSIPNSHIVASVARGAELAVGAVPRTGVPTSLLQGDGTGLRWSIDSSLLDEHSDAVAFTIGQYGDHTVVAGHSGDPNHPDAWLTSDDASWTAMPGSLHGGPGGILNLIAKIDDRVILAGTAPELDRYYTIDLADLGEPGSGGSDKCDGSNLGGINTDARNWTSIDNGAKIDLFVLSDCVLRSLDITTWSGQTLPRRVDRDPAELKRVPVRAGDVITVTVAHDGGVGCEREPDPGFEDGWLAVSVGLYTAQSRRAFPMNPDCRYSYSIEKSELDASPEYPACSTDNGFAHTGERDYAGTRNATFTNRGNGSCRIDAVDVHGATDAGERIPYTDYGDREVSGIPRNVLPVLLGPGRGVVVMLVSRPTCLPPETSIVSTSVAVAGHTIDIPAGLGDGCPGSYTVALFEEAEATNIPFAECGLLPEPGPPTGQGAQRLNQLRSELEADGLFEQPDVVSSAKRGGVISVGLSHRNRATIDWLAKRADPDNLCLELPPPGYYDQPPTLADWELGSIESEGTTVILMVSVGPCGLLDESRILEPQIEYSEAEVVVGVPLAVQTYGPVRAVCLPPTELTVELDEPLAGRKLVAATDLNAN